jgi:15-cis-phytoene synthase
MTRGARAPELFPPDLVAEAAAAIAAGSTSFAAAARLLDPATRESAALLYAWCRHCDDVIDGQTLGHAARPSDGCAGARLDVLVDATQAALDGRPPETFPFRALAAVAARHAIPNDLPLAHLSGFRLDVEGLRYRTLDELLVYCWGVAGVVGVMMARIMGVSDRDTLDRAADLGLAFQLTNVARDVAEDAAVGRVYLPLAWLDEAGVPAGAVGDPGHRAAVAQVAARLVAAAEPFYDSALVGIGRLPVRSAAAIGAARAVYRAIGRKVVDRRETAWEARVHTSRAEKLIQVARGTGAAVGARALTRRPRDPALWRQGA